MTHAAVSIAPSGFCWTANQKRGVSRHKGVSSSEETWLGLFHYVIMWKSPTGCPHSTSPPPPTRCSRLSAVINGPWEFLTTIWFAPLQRTLWPAWTLTCIHEHTYNCCFHHKDVRKGNWKWQPVSQTDWFWAMYIIWFADTGTMIVSVCAAESNCCVFYSVSVKTHCLI